MTLKMKPFGNIVGKGENAGYQHGGLVLEHLLREREVAGSIPRCHRPKSLKLVVVASPLALRITEIALRLARQCQDNGLVKYR